VNFYLAPDTEGPNLINKAALESYLRNLAGQVVGAILIVTQTSGLATPLDFGTGEWLLVANALWASAIPTIIRFLNEKDPAFGRVAEVVAVEVTKKLSTASASAKKPAAKKRTTTKK
jgi:translation elongation factor EF-Tu-like GTPase